jgi:hypothetical protein
VDETRQTSMLCSSRQWLTAQSSDTLSNLAIFEGQKFSIFLPIIISFEEVEIADSYHKFLGLTRSGV